MDIDNVYNFQYTKQYDISSIILRMAPGLFWSWYCICIDVHLFEQLKSDSTFNKIVPRG